MIPLEWVKGRGGGKMLGEFYHGGRVYDIKSHLELFDINDEILSFSGKAEIRAFFNSVVLDPIAKPTVFQIAKWHYPRLCCQKYGCPDLTIEQVVDQLSGQIANGDLVLIAKKPTERNKGAKYFEYSSGTWTQDTTLKAELGQSVRIEARNVNPLGTTIEIWASNTNQIKQSVLIPYKKMTFAFFRFGAEPQAWEFRIKTKSDAFVVNFAIKSTWIPGTQPNR